MVKSFCFFEKFLLFTYNIECDKICTQKALWRSQIYRFLNGCGNVSTLLPMRVWINFNLLVPAAALTIISSFFVPTKKYAPIQDAFKIYKICKILILVLFSVVWMALYCFALSFYNQLLFCFMQIPYLQLY